MALTLKFATEADIPALLQLRLTVDADQARRFGNDRWSMTISEQRRRSRVGRQLMDRAKVCGHRMAGRCDPLGRIRWPIGWRAFLREVRLHRGRAEGLSRSTARLLRARASRLN